jgi:antirestriction protein
MLNPLISTEMKLQFGELNITPRVVSRLHELDFTVPELEDAIQEHVSHLDDEPSIYCGTYAKYNEGSLCGLWIDLSSFDDYNDFINFCKAIHADEDDPELMFQDYQGFPREYYTESCMDEDDFYKIFDYKRMCDLHGAEAIDDYIDLDHDLADFEEAYCGEWDSEEDFARHIVDECYDLDRQMGSLARYFDYEAFARELFMYDYTMGANGNVFRNL